MKRGKQNRAKRSSPKNSQACPTSTKQDQQSSTACSQRNPREVTGTRSRAPVPRCRRGTGPIQFLLGHVSVQTTERYLGCKQRLRNVVNDRIGIEPTC